MEPLTYIVAIKSLAPGASFGIYANSLDRVDWQDENISRPSNADIEAELIRLQSAEPIRLLRVDRDRLLASTDWWASSDLVMSDERKAYRQALRDLPSGLDTEEKVKNVTWPAKP